MAKTQAIKPSENEIRVKSLLDSKHYIFKPIYVGTLTNSPVSDIDSNRYYFKILGDTVVAYLPSIKLSKNTPAVLDTVNLIQFTLLHCKLKFERTQSLMVQINSDELNGYIILAVPPEGRVGVTLRIYRYLDKGGLFSGFIREL